jgi:tetratricopeptide (TPR) repeat protein/tRNA A-37 threonylcarbamoyl transferase component Bud32
MSFDERILDLLERWEEHRKLGQPIALADLCADCPELLEEVRQRIAALQALDPLLCRPSTTPEASDGPEAKSDDHDSGAPSGLSWSPPGLRYRPLHFHKGGGLGEVFVAHDEELNREVALKRIRPERQDDADSRRRFMREAEITGRLEHPGVVPVHGLVHDETGQPCYAMRFVRGGSLQDAILEYHHTDRAALDPGERSVALRQLLSHFLATCKAVAYAHSRGILHRDLKPQNIMLGKYGETLVVDWGLAKTFSRTEADRAQGEESLTPASQADMGSTQLGAALGTPAYMSPEQATGQWDNLRPSSDIFSLGATLYALLTRQAPYRGDSPREVLEQARTGVFPLPRHINREVPRALEAICLKAMARDPNRRYGTAMELAADIERWLADQPVGAWREPLMAWLLRWSWRHRSGVALTILLLAALWLGAGLFLLDAERRETELARQKAVKQGELAQEAQHYAEAESQKKDKMVELLRGIFDASDPLGMSGLSFYIPPATGEELTLKQALDRGVVRITRETGQDPQVHAALMDTIGSVYRQLGKYREAEPLLSKAYDIRQQLLRPDDPDLAQSAHNLAWLWQDKGDYDAAYPLYCRARDIREKQFGHEDPQTVATLFNLAWLVTQMEDFAQAEQLFREVIAVRERTLGTENREVALAKLGLAALYLEEGDYLRAMGPSLASMQMMQRLEGDNPVVQAAGLYQRAVIAMFAGRDLDAAERDLTTCARVAEELLGPGHVYVAFVLTELAYLEERKGDNKRAEELYRRCVAIARDQVGFGHPKVAALIGRFTHLLVESGQRSEGEQLCQELLEVHRKRFGPTHKLVADALLTYAEFLASCREPARQQKALDEALTIYAGATQRPSRMHFSALVQAALVRARNGGSLDEAEDLMRQAQALARKLPTRQHYYLATAHAQLAGVLLKRGRSPDEVGSLLDEAEALCRQHLSGNRQVEVLTLVLWNRGSHHLQTGRLAESVKAVIELAKLHHKESGILYEIACHLAQCSARVGGGKPGLRPAEQAERTRYGDAAVEMLQQAIEGDDKFLEKLRKDKRLDPLRSRKDFQEWQTVPDPK